MASTIFIYSSLPTGRGRDELEDAIEELLGDRGSVTGAGQGQRGWNVDIEVLEEDDFAAVCDELIPFLQSWPVGRDTYFMGEGKRINVFDDA